MTDLRPVCACGRKLPKIAASDVAIEIVKRTCRGCGQRWSVRIVPTASREFKIHEVWLTPINPLRR